MCKLDPVLSLEGDAAISRYCDAEDRNDQAQRELKNYESTHSFLFVHAITQQYQSSIQLESQVLHDPESFSQALFNAKNNLAKYRSKLNQNRYRDELERLTFAKKIEEYEKLIDLMKKIMQGQAQAVRH
jgi:hypothetical protein